MKIVILVAITLALSVIVKAQNLPKLNIFAGYGFYEAFNLGTEYTFKSQQQSVSVSVGYAKMYKKHNKALTMSYNFAVFKQFNNNVEGYKWHINNKLVAWQLEDDFYLWKAISIIPSLNRSIFFQRRLHISVDIGPSFNIILYSKRKTFSELGWPYHISPNFRFLFIY